MALPDEFVTWSGSNASREYHVSIVAILFCECEDISSEICSIYLSKGKCILLASKYFWFEVYELNDSWDLTMER